MKSVCLEWNIASIFKFFYPVPPYKCELVVDSETVMGTHKSCLSRVQSPSLFLSPSQMGLWLPDDNFPILIRDGVVCSRYSFLKHKCHVNAFKKKYIFKENLGSMELKNYFKWRNILTNSFWLYDFHVITTIVEVDIYNNWFKQMNFLSNGR